MNSKTTKCERPNYFNEPLSAEDAAIRRVKGNFRREMVLKTSLNEGWAAIPEDWRAHDIPEELKNALALQAGPQARGGEDLPNLDDDEVEIARLSLVSSLHGEVTSLRAKRDPKGSSILLSMVDEYDTEFQLPVSRVSTFLTAKEVLQVFQDAEPTPTDTSCQMRFTSFFYADLDHLAVEMGIKSSDCVIDHEPEVEPNDETALRRPAIQQAAYGESNRWVTKEDYEAAKKRLRGERKAGTKLPASKDYIFAAFGMIAFCIALPFTQAGSVLLHGGISARELLASSITSGLRGVASSAFWLASGFFSWLVAALERSLNDSSERTCRVRRSSRYFLASYL